MYAKLFNFINNKGLLKKIPDELYIHMFYKAKTGKQIDLKHPKLLNEKLQYLKLNDHNPLYTNMVDKYKVKEYIKKNIGDKYVNPTLAVWDKPEDINLESLPEQFILKCNHDSGSLIVCKDKSKLDMNEVKKKLCMCLKENYYLKGREWPYKNIERKIIAEPYLSNKDGSAIVDYKFYCYGGMPRYFMYSLGEAEHKVKNHKFDMELHSIDYLFKKSVDIEIDEIHLPDNIETMIDIVKKLCVDFQHVRIDLYNVDGKIYFGEFTFYTNGGIINIENEEYAQKMADYIDIGKAYGK